MSFGFGFGSGTNSGSSTVHSVTLTIPPEAGAGDLIFAVVTVGGTSPSINKQGLTDSNGSTWQWVATLFPGGNSSFGTAVGIFFALTTTVAPVNSTISYTDNSTGPWEMSLSVMYFGGGAAGTSVDIDVSQSSTSGFSTLSSGLPNANNEVLCALNVDLTGTNETYSGATGWANATTNFSGSHQTLIALDYLVQTTKSSVNYLPVYAGTNNHTTVSAIISFKAFVPPTGTLASTDTADTLNAMGQPRTGVWASTESPDTAFIKANAMTVVESIPVRITTTLPGFNQVMEVEEVPQTYFVTAIASTTLPGFGQLMLVKNTDPIPITVTQEAPPGRGGGGAQPTISIEKELADLFHGRSFNRGIDSAVPSTRVAAGQLTTPFSPRPITQPPRRRK